MNVNTYEQARTCDQPTSPVVRNLANKKEITSCQKLRLTIHKV